MFSPTGLFPAIRNPGAFARCFPLYDGTDAIHAYCCRKGEEHVIDARMFDVIDEDPATGSANAALTGLIASLDPVPNLDLNITIHQGEDMGRPSRIYGRVEKRDGKLGRVQVMGYCAPVMAGQLDPMPQF